MEKPVSIKMYISTIACLMIIIAILIGVYLLPQNNEQDSKSYEALSMQYGETMEGFQVENAFGEILDGLPKTNKDRVVIYLSSTCHGCVDILENFERMSSVFGKEEISYIFLWNDDMPELLMEEYQIDSAFCYKLVDKKIATTTPTYYIVDKDEKINFVTTDAKLLVERVINMEIIPRDILMENANVYIKDNFFDDTEKEKLVYFAMDGCPDCEAIEPIVESQEMQEKYEVATVYKYDDIEESRIKDSYGIFKEIYGIKWYPSFLIFNGEQVDVIGETPIEELRSLLLDK
uniref:thioredoxin family protein n=1 Tax=Acetatifactor sp. TaxID=1872090 RepID=UPI004056C2E8